MRTELTSYGVHCRGEGVQGVEGIVKYIYINSVYIVVKVSTP